MTFDAFFQLVIYRKKFLLYKLGAITLSTNSSLFDALLNLRHKMRKKIPRHPPCLSQGPRFQFLYLRDCRNEFPMALLILIDLISGEKRAGEPRCVADYRITAEAVQLLLDIPERWVEIEGDVLLSLFPVNPAAGRRSQGGKRCQKIETSFLKTIDHEAFLYLLRKHYFSGNQKNIIYRVSHLEL